MKLAVSTEDEKTLTNDHFGEGEVFLIYHIDSQGYKLLEKRVNTSPEEDEHGSEKKAKGIMEILGDIPILLGYQFGPNIMRIKERFLPIVSRYKDIQHTLKMLIENYENLKNFEDQRGIVLILDNRGLRRIPLKDEKYF